MKTKIFLIISIIGLLSLIFITQINQNTLQGKIKSIKQFDNKISLYLENTSEEIIIFDSEKINLQKGELILIEYKKEEYKNRPQFVANKITKIK